MAGVTVTFDGNKSYSNTWLRSTTRSTNMLFYLWSSCTNRIVMHLRQLSLWFLSNTHFIVQFLFRLSFCVFMFVCVFMSLLICFCLVFMGLAA